MLKRLLARRTVRIGLATSAAVAAGAAWLGAAPSGALRPNAAGTHVADTGAPRPVASAAYRESPPGESAVVQSLSGSMPPRLPLEDGGRLARSRAVRDFFDYFLTAQHEVEAHALDAMVRREIAAQLDGTAAQGEALDVWRRYGTYRETVARIAPLQTMQPGNAAGGGPTKLDAMRSALDESASIARRTMGAAWSEAFFGREWRRANDDIERLRVMSDTTLNDAQRAARLDALAGTLPLDERAAAERETRLRAAVTEIAALQNEGLPPDALQAAATQALGPEAAQRVMQMQKVDDAWRAKYADYAAQRARIEAMALAPPDRDAQVVQLRERMFATAAERLRAASLDEAAGDGR
jgi:lipase chaperone LimK